MSAHVILKCIASLDPPPTTYQPPLWNQKNHLTYYQCWSASFLFLLILNWTANIFKKLCPNKLESAVVYATASFPALNQIAAERVHVKLRWIVRFIPITHIREFGRYSNVHGALAAAQHDRAHGAKQEAGRGSSSNVYQEELPACAWWENDWDIRFFERQDR